MQPFAVHQDLDEHTEYDAHGGKLLQHGGGNVHQPVERLTGIACIGFHAFGHAVEIGGDQDNGHHDEQRGDRVGQVCEITGPAGRNVMDRGCLRILVPRWRGLSGTLGCVCVPGDDIICR